MALSSGPGRRHAGRAKAAPSSRTIRRWLDGSSPPVRDPIQPAEVLSAAEYERVRPRALDAMRRQRRDRRVRIDPSLTLLFENRATVLLQIHEVLRVEGRWTATDVAREIAAYAALLPSRGLGATVLVDGGTREVADDISAALRHGRALAVERAGRRRWAALGPDEDPWCAEPVRYVRFDVDGQAIGFDTRLVLCRRASEVSVFLPDATRRALVDDLRP